MKTIITGVNGFVGRYLKNYVVDDSPIIYNLASNSSVETSINDPTFVVLNNINCMLDILERAKELQPKALIHLSTVEASRPSNPYAASKAAQEAIAKAYFNTYGVPVIIARSHNIVGEGQSPDKFIPKLIEQIKAGEVVNIYGNGSRIYNPVLNIIDALNYLGIRGEHGKTYLIGGGERVTNLGMAKKVASILGLPLKYKLVAGRPGYKRALRGEGAKIDGWEPPITLDKGLAWIK